MKTVKYARVAAQAVFFLFVTASFVLLSFPFKFITAKEFFLSSPSLVALAALAGQYVIPLFLAVTLFVLAALLFGRVFCGWMCPFGAVMDFFAFLCSPFKKYKEKEPGKKLIFKYYMLAAFAVLAVFGYQFVWIFEPVTVFSRFFHLSFFPFINALTDKIFRYTIINYDFGESVYYAVSGSIFSAGSISFRGAAVFFILFMVPAAAVIFRRRLWCRYVCPLGASLGIMSVSPKFPLRQEACRLNCGKCVQLCRSNAIRHDGSYIPNECVMCMDCLSLKCYNPEKNAPDLKYAEKAPESSRNAPLPSGITRKQFLFWGSGALAAVYMSGRKAYASSRIQKSRVIRPPGAMPEKQFKQACVRCGNCMKVCITNGLQPVLLESGIDGVWTPRVDNIAGYCEYNCNACGQVCPTQAINALSMEEKTELKIGNAVIIKEKCVPWKDGIECLVCEEHCPVPDKAIKFVKETINGSEIDVPVVDFHLCIGCGVCENKCPVEGKDRGITVNPLFPKE